MNKNNSIFMENFLGHSPIWYKKLILFFLLLNPIIILTLGKVTAGWFILIEFIITLALSLKCYPLLSGGLIAIEAIFMKLMDVHNVFEEIEHNIEVLFLLIFMVAGIYFMKDFLSWIFTKLLFITESKILLSLIFMLSCVFLSAWLDALTVIAVMITVTTSFYEIYNSTSYSERVPMEIKGIDISKYSDDDENDLEEGEIKNAILERRVLGRKDLNDFESFLRNILMHSAIGTAIGGASTIVGEPQNLIIGNLMGWDFGQFFFKVFPISIPVLIVGIFTLIILEKFKILGYGYQLPIRVKNILKKHAVKQEKLMTKSGYFKLLMQMLGGIWLIIGLALHLAPVGLIGLSLIIFMTVLTGKNEEHQIGKAFEESLPFASLLIVFFAIVSLINS
ncbi:MAG: SLC13 family permease, partial [Candidatus Sericytochromatia bacterium]